MKTFLRFLIAFLALTGAVAIATGSFGVEFGNQDYWARHGFLFLVCLAFFPRLTLIFSALFYGMVTGGIVWWLGWLFVPRILVAYLATIAYWNQNPILVIIAWLIAFSGESSEKYVIRRRGQYKRNHFKVHVGGFPPPGGRPGTQEQEGKGFEKAKWVKPE